MTDVEWELGPLAPLKVGSRVRITGAVTYDVEFKEEIIYHFIPVGSWGIVRKISDYGMVLVEHLEVGTQTVFMEDLEVL